MDGVRGMGCDSEGKGFSAPTQERLQLGVLWGKVYKNCTRSVDVEMHCLILCLAVRQLLLYKTGLPSCRRSEFEKIAIAA